MPSALGMVEQPILPDWLAWDMFGAKCDLSVGEGHRIWQACTGIGRSNAIQPSVFERSGSAKKLVQVKRR
jgi:hypothetical protein